MKTLIRVSFVYAVLFFLKLNGFGQYIATYAGPPLPMSGQPALTQALDFPSSVAVDGVGGFFVPSPTQNRVYHVAADGTLALSAGTGNPGYRRDGGLAVLANLAHPTGVAVDAAGNLFIADAQNNRIRRVTPDGIITTVAGSGISGLGDGGAAFWAQLNHASGVALDAGNLFIADTLNHRIRKVTPDGIITTVAGSGTGGFSGDRGPAVSAQLNYPYSVAVDASGNLFIADTLNHRIRKVTPDGIITTVAGSGTGGFSGDRGPAISAQLNSPYSVAVDASENLFIADTGNDQIRKVTDGIIMRVAGNGDGGFSLEQLYVPTGAAVDAAGNLFIADTRNNRIRKVGPVELPPVPRVGSFAQVVSGAQWNTRMTLTNLSSTTVTARISFYTNDGFPLILPLIFANSSTANTSSSFANLTIGASRSVVIDTPSSTASLNVGWADVRASGPLEGYAVFREGQTTGLSSEGTVPLDTRLSSSLVLPYDNTNGSKTAIALANQSAASATITVVVLDQGGTPLMSSEMILPALGHASFFETDMFPQAANRIGLIEFQNPSGNVTGIGLLFYPGGAFTSLPIIQ